MKNTFALIHTWPELRNAEYEVLQRILTAAHHVDKRVVLIDNSGSVIWSSQGIEVPIGETLPKGVVDFVLSLHFESPRVLDEYSYYALWQPIAFYHDFSYQPSIDRFTSHNDVLSCRSDLADAHAINLMSALGRAPLEPLPTLFHAVPEPFLNPDISADSRLFYIGINWERIGRPKGRFHDVLVMLDKGGLTDIYGPELMMGVAPWEGFNTYRGELPFDGKSIKRAINSAGICLALSSTPHKNTGIMSNRLFEAFAGGGAVIATPNPLIDKLFRDSVYLVDDTQGETVLGQQIVEAMREIRADPEEATRRTILGQKIVRQNCLLETSIESLFHSHNARLAAFETSFLAHADVTIIIYHQSGSKAALIEQLERHSEQKNAVLDVHILCEPHVAQKLEDKVSELTRGAIRSLVFHPLRSAARAATFDGIASLPPRSGKIVNQILRSVTTRFFAFVSPEDAIHSDHFASLAKTIEAEPQARMACSGAIRASIDGKGKISRTLESMRFADLDSITLVHGPEQRARFLFDRSLLDGNFNALMQLLDGEEHRYFMLAALLEGPLAQSNYASYVRDETVLATKRDPAEPAELQQQYIRDRFTRDPRWMERLSKGVKLPEFVFAYSPGSPIRWSDYTAPSGINKRVALNRMLPTSIGGAGLPLLIEGFSYPEAQHTWLAAERGVIEFALDADGQLGDYELVLMAEGRRAHETGRQQHCTIAVNGMVVSYLLVPDVVSEVRFKIPINLVRNSTTFRIELTPDHSELVYDRHGTVIDDRRLSMRILSIAVMKVLPVGALLLHSGQMYDCTASGVGPGILVENFYAPEEKLTWLAGTRGGIHFKIEGIPRKPRLKLRVIGRSSLADGSPQRIELDINGAPLGSYILQDAEQDIEIDINRELINLGGVYLKVAASHAEAVFDQDHQILDNRLIGVAVVAIGILEGEDAPAESGKRTRIGIQGWLQKRF